MSGESEEVCRNFRNNNTCRYGDKCRFNHSEGEPIQVPSKPPGQCFKFQEENGNCSKGDRCRFMHGENDTRFDSEGKRDVSNEICNNHKRGRCTLGDKCLRQHVEVEAKDESEANEGGNRRRQRERKPRQRKSGECFDFRDKGQCEHGDECRFTHGDNDTRFPAAAADEEGDAPRNSARRRRRGGGGGGRDGGSESKENLEEQECNNYKAGRCRFGDSCRRTHVGDVAPVAVEKIDEICNNFQNNRCRFGDFCRRQHIAN
jgi:hypothetical protein